MARHVRQTVNWSATVAVIGAPVLHVHDERQTGHTRVPRARGKFSGKPRSWKPRPTVAS